MGKKQTRFSYKQLPWFILVLVFGGVIYLGSKNDFTLNLKFSPELHTFDYSHFSNNRTRAIPASCGFTMHGSPDEAPVACSVVDCSGYQVYTTGTSQCGGTCISSNPNVCSQYCFAGLASSVSYTGYIKISNGIYMYPSGSGRPTPQYTIGNCYAGVPPGYSRMCSISRYINGSPTNWTENYDASHTIWSSESPRVYPYSEELHVRCSYMWNATGAMTLYGDWAIAKAATLHPNAGLPCTNTNACGVSANGTYDDSGICTATPPANIPCNVTNICGQPFSGNICGGVCNAGGGPDTINNSCIPTFKSTTDKTTPNSSVEFSWAAINTHSTPRCSFVDLTTPTPRPIAGLQNLDPNTNRARITNIQTTTRFCLVCSFYSLSNPALKLGEVVKHQWVKVEKILEN